jgi:hypothetical protein
MVTGLLLLLAGRAAGDGLEQPLSGGRGDAPELAKQSVERTVDQLAAEADLRLLRQLAEQAGDRPASGSVVPELEAIDAEARKDLVDLVERKNQPLLHALEKSAEDAGQKREAVVAEWRRTRGELYAQRLELFEVEHGQQIAGQLASLLSVDNRWFWLFGLVPVASLVVIAMHERRHDFRRWLNGGRARAMGLSKFLTGLMVLLALVTLTVFVFGDRLYHWLLRVGEEKSPHQEMVAANDLLTEQVRIARQERATAEAAHAEALARWRKVAEEDRALNVLTAQLEHEHALLIEINRDLAVERGVAGRLQEDLGQLAEVHQQIVHLDEERTAYLRKREWIRGGLGLGLLGIATTGGLLFQRGVRRRLRKTRDTCPLCLGQGKFEPLGEMSDGAGHPGLEMAQCKNVISEQPYEECDFTFSTLYRDNVKLCFPTLGIPQAGKTHWLAMVYRELNRGNFPGVVQFERIRSSSSDEFDLVVDEILNKKLGPMATQVGRIPHPLIFNFLDHDRLGPSNVLVNIFDYSGEVTRSQTIEDRQRQRALDGDGFFFFLDPTEPSETQSQALAGFREDLRRIKGLPTGKQVQVPIALCVSKIDLMVNQSYADPRGLGVVERFYQELGELGWETDLASIEARSRLLARLRDMVWPGWQIERQIDDLFGGRFLFFPLTPVGLDGLGERDLSRRTISPVGLLDPLLWLLHMNGYPVL